MDDNSIFMSIVNYIWLVIVVIPFFGGLGFIYAGWRVDEPRWMDEGIIYMIPFILLSFTIFDMIIVYLGIILWILCMLRAAIIFKRYREKLSDKMRVRQQESDDNIVESNYRLNHFLEENSASNVNNSESYNSDFGKNFDSIKQEKVNINRASFEELIRIPCFDEKIVQDIIYLRERGEYVDSADDLSSKLNIDDDKIGKIIPYICFEKDKKENVRRIDL